MRQWLEQYISYHQNFPCRLHVLLHTKPFTAATAATASRAVSSATVPDLPVGGAGRRNHSTSAPILTLTLTLTLTETLNLTLTLTQPYP